MEIQDHDFGPQPLERRHALLAGPLARHLVAQALEVVPDGAEHVAVVIDEQQGLSHGAIPPSPLPVARSPDPRGSARHGGAAGSRTACRPTARRRAGSAAAGRPAPPPPPCRPARTTAPLSPPPCAAGATPRGTPPGPPPSPPPAAPARRASRRRGRCRPAA